MYFVACGVSRLARYNITASALSEGTGKVKYFEGTPIPTSLMLVVVIAVAAWTGAIGERLWFGVVHVGPWQFHPLVAMFRYLRIADDQPDLAYSKTVIFRFGRIAHARRFIGWLSAL